MSTHFRFTFWDPVLIISQILTIQCLFYTSLCFIMAVMCSLARQSPSLSYIFDYRALNAKTVFGIGVTCAHLINTVCGAAYLWYFVQRAKPCLDYSVTIYIIHLLLCCIYNGFLANTYSWWIMNTICIACTCIFGELLCSRTEMKAIPLSQKSDV